MVRPETPAPLLITRVGSAITTDVPDVTRICGVTADSMIVVAPLIPICFCAPVAREAVTVFRPAELIVTVEAISPLASDISEQELNPHALMREFVGETLRVTGTWGAGVVPSE